MSRRTSRQRTLADFAENLDSLIEFTSVDTQETPVLEAGPQGTAELPVIEDSPTPVVALPVLPEDEPLPEPPAVLRRSGRHRAPRTAPRQLSPMGYYLCIAAVVVAMIGVAWAVITPPSEPVAITAPSEAPTTPEPEPTPTRTPTPTYAPPPEPPAPAPEPEKTPTKKPEKTPEPKPEKMQEPSPSPTPVETSESVPASPPTGDGVRKTDDASGGSNADDEDAENDPPPDCPDGDGCTPNPSDGEPTDTDSPAAQSS